MTRGPLPATVAGNPVGAAVAARIREMRMVAGLSCEALAAKCGPGFTRSVIDNIERGRKGSLSIDELAVIATALGVRPYELWPDLEGPEPAWLELSEPEASAFTAWLRKHIRIKPEET